MTPSTSHLLFVFLFPTHVQSLAIFLPFHDNSKRTEEQVEQASHVSGHISATPSISHLSEVALFPTQVQFLVIFFPFHETLKRSDESKHSSSTGVSS